MVEHTPMRIGLQYFASEGDPEPAAAAVVPEPKPETPAKTFSQAEVDKIVKDRLARGSAATQPAATVPGQAPVPPAIDTTVFETKIATLSSALVTAEVKSSMAIYGVIPERIERAARLVDPTKCVGDDGQPDVAKIKKEVEDLLKDFPELKPSGSGDGGNTFRIGADGNKTDTGATKDAISSIFGNKKG